MKSIKKQVEEKLNIPFTGHPSREEQEDVERFQKTPRRNKRLHQGPLGEVHKRPGTMTKLAEKLLKEFLLSDEIGDPEWRTTIFEMMEAYHKARMAEITDDDIKDWANYNSLSSLTCYGMMEGAKAMRDGEIVKSNNTKK